MYIIAVANGGLVNTIVSNKSMKVIIEQVCNGCKHCQNFKTQCATLKVSGSIPFTAFQEFYNMHSVDMAKVMVEILKDHIHVTRVNDRKPKNRKGLSKLFYTFVMKHEGTMFQQVEKECKGKKRATDNVKAINTDTEEFKPRLIWKRCHGVSWPVIADVFNKMQKDEPVPSLTLRKALCIINKHIDGGKKYVNGRWLSKKSVNSSQNNGSKL
jgi:hypothetical protein